MRTQKGIFKSKINSLTHGLVSAQDKSRSKKTELKKEDVKVWEGKEDGDAKPKRGQHGRKKKLKEKYKFQDDEERKLRIRLLKVLCIFFCYTFL